MMVKQADLPKLKHTNAEVLAYLLESRNRKYVHAVDHFGRRLSETNLLKVLKEYVCHLEFPDHVSLLLSPEVLVNWWHPTFGLAIHLGHWTGGLMYICSAPSFALAHMFLSRILYLIHAFISTISRNIC